MHVLVILVVAWLADGRVALNTFPYPDQSVTHEECQATADQVAQGAQTDEPGKYRDVRMTCVSLDLVHKKDT